MKGPGPARHCRSGFHKNAETNACPSPTPETPLAASDNRFASIPARLLLLRASPQHPAYYVRDAAGWQATNWG